MRTSTFRCAIPLSLLLLLGGSCTGRFNGENSSTAELQWKVQSLQREVAELRRTQPQIETTSIAEIATTGPTTGPAYAEALEKIRDEGLNRSQVMGTLGYLTDVIGPRLTGSPQLLRANEWTREKMASWGLVNAHLEPWGLFGRGWSLKKFSAQVVEPQVFPLNAYPKAWSPGLKGTLTAEVFFIDGTLTELEQYKGKLKGAIVLAGAPRTVLARWEPLAMRNSDSDLLKMANSEEASVGPSGQARASNASERAASFGDTPVGRLRAARAQRAGATTTTSMTPLSAAQLLKFAANEGAALVITTSTQGDGGTFFVAQANVPGVERQQFPATQPGPRVWAMDAPAIPPQMTLAVEQYNRLVRMIQAGEKVKMSVDLAVEFHDNQMAYNTIAEIPGTDLKDEIVMLGAHMDSWHSGTGATDNGAGCAAAMEAVRILKALDLHPRRTIRVALWTGEEQGIFGSKAYVSEHFGSYPEPASRPTTGPTTRPSADFRPTTRPIRSQLTRNLTKRAEYDKISAYFNLDHGTGKIRGIYLQGNEQLRPLFRRWLAPFSDLDAQTITLANTGGTDHVSFDAIGIPAFQFIQDPIEYWSRTHHSNADVFDRIQADDMKQASVILASFVYNTAMLDERLPRKIKLTQREVEAKTEAQTQPVK